MTEIKNETVTDQTNIWFGISSEKFKELCTIVGEVPGKFSFPLFTILNTARQFNLVENNDNVMVEPPKQPLT